MSLLTMKNRFSSPIFLTAVLLLAPLEAAFAQMSNRIEEASTFQFNPPDDGIPGNTTGGASRPIDDCRVQQSAVRASNIVFLAPKSFVGLTVSAHPKFLINIGSTSAQQLFFNIQNELGETIFQDFRPIQSNTGLVNIELPEDAPSLEVNEVYRISLVPVCEASLRPDDPVITGFVKRVPSPELPEEVTTESHYEMAQQYAQQGIWYDTALLLVEGLKSEPTNENLSYALSTLLESGGFAEEETSANASL